MPRPVDDDVQVDLYSSAFCEPCRVTRGRLDEAARLVPAARVRDRDVAAFPDEAELDGIRVTPTVVVRDDAGREVFRAEGVPSLPQLLVAMAKAVA